MKNKKPVRQGILKHMDVARAHLDFAGARVLEIGGDQWQASAQMMIDAGARHVTTINIVKGWPEHEDVSPQLTKIKANANHLSQHFEPDSFDIAYGIAVLEHVSQSWLMLDELAKVVKPGGMCYLHGGPIWTSGKGHHLFTKYEGQQFRFSDKDCPIEKWEHLLGDTDALAKRIETRGLTPEAAAYLADWIYTTPEQNRYGYARLCEIFEAAPMRIVKRLDNAFAAPPPEVLRALAVARGPSKDRYDVSGVTFVLKNDAN
ncbi:MAG: class I SAM-dependent methyltransferase [Sedimentitalea sp.]